MGVKFWICVKGFSSKIFTFGILLFACLISNVYIVFVSVGHVFLPLEVSYDQLFLLFLALDNYPTDATLCDFLVFFNRVTCYPSSNVYIDFCLSRG